MARDTSKLVTIPGELHSAATGNIVAAAEEVFDYTSNKYQKDINQEVAYIKEDGSVAPIPSFNPQSQTVHLDEQVLSNAQKKQVRKNIGLGNGDIDSTPTSGSDNVVRSGGVYSSMQELRSTVNPQVGYYTCSTAGNTAAKVIDASGYTLLKGGGLRVNFTEKNTAANATLNIEQTGAKPLYYNGVRVSTNNSWYAGEIVTLFYDGAAFQCNSLPDLDEYDVSARNGGQAFTFEEAVALVPEAYKHGGLKLRFISNSDSSAQTNDNKYVQYMYNGTSTTVADFIEVTNWEKINLEKEIGDVLLKIGEFTLNITWKESYKFDDSLEFSATGAVWRAQKIDITAYAGASVEFYGYTQCGFINKDDSVDLRTIDAGEFSTKQKWTIPSNAKYLCIAWATSQTESNPITVVKSGSIESQISNLENEIREVDDKIDATKIYTDLWIEPQILSVVWLDGYWSNSDLSEYNSSTAYRRCKVGVSAYAGNKVTFKGYKYCGFELEDGTIQSTEISALDYEKWQDWTIPLTAKCLYISYAIGQGEQVVTVTKENNVQYRLDHLDNTERGREQEYNNIAYNKTTIISFLDKYNRRDVDSYNQLNIALAGDSIFGIQGDTAYDSSHQNMNTHQVSFTKDMNDGSDNLAKDTGHFAPNMYTQNVAYRLLQELQFPHADVKYYNHIASEVSKTGTWTNIKAIEDEVYLAETSTVDSAISLGFSGATFVKFIFSRYNRPVPTATEVKVEFSTDGGTTWVTPASLNLVESIQSDASGNLSLPSSNVRYKFGEVIYGGLNVTQTYIIRVTSISSDKLLIWGFETWSNPRLNIIITAQGANTAENQLENPERFYDDMYKQSLVIIDVPFLNDLGSGIITNGFYRGIATTTTTPISSPSEGIFYYAGEDGTYSNFGGLECLKDDCITYDGAHWYIGKGSYLDGKLSNYYGQLDALLRRLCTLGIPVLCMVTHSSGSFLTRPFTVEGANYMRSLVKKYGLPHIDINYIQEKYIPFGSILEANGTGTHLNDAGMQLYFEQINKIITKNCNIKCASYPRFDSLPIRGHADSNTVNFGYQLAKIPVVRIYGNNGITISSISNSGFVTTGSGEYDWEAIVQI